MMGTEDDQDDEQVTEVGDELSPMMGAQNRKRQSRTSSGGEKHTPRTSNVGGGGGGGGGKKKITKNDVSSQLLLGGSLHSTLSHRPYDNLDRLQTPSSSSSLLLTSSTHDRNTMFRKRHQRPNLVTGRSSSGNSNSNSRKCSTSNSRHAMSSNHSIRRRHSRSLSIGSGDGADDDYDDDDDDDDLNDDFDGFGGHGNKGDFDGNLSCHKHRRNHSNSDGTDDDDDDSVASPKARASSSFLSFFSPARRGRQQARKDDNGDIHYDDVGSFCTHPFPELNCRAGGIAQELFQTLEKRQKRQIQLLIVALIVSGIYLYHELNVHLERQEMLLEHYSNKHDVMHRLQQMQHVQSGKDLTDDPALVGREQENPTVLKNGHEDQIHHLSGKISSLQMTLQVMARQQLMNALALDDETGIDQPMNVALTLHGLEHRPLVMQVQWAEMPHTTWTFLRQMTSTGTRWTLQAKHPWMEILPVNNLEDAAPAMTDQQAFGLEFLEESTLDLDRTFIVGMRNAPKGENDAMNYPRISIYSERGMCGHIDNEACFGKIVDGFELLNFVRTMEEDVAIDKVSVATAASL